MTDDATPNSADPAPDDAVDATADDAGPTTDAARESRTARLRTTHADAATVAAALRPDNTDAMEMAVEGDTLVTTVSRETTGGLQSTVDDTVVNLTVADAIVDTTRTHNT